jgi:protein-disulfide isomerase
MSNGKMTRAERRAKVKRQKQMQSVGLMIIGVLIIIGAIVLVTFLQPKLALPAEYDYGLVNGNALGDPNAPIVIEEFSSFGCSHCRDFALETEHQIIENYVKTGQVYYIYRAFNNPIDAYGIASQAAYCAGDHGFFWEMHDMIFANFSATGYTSKQLNKMAEILELDEGQFNTCMDTGKYVETIQEDAIAGTEAGVTGTPSFTINGVLAIQGNRDFAGFQTQIEAALAAANN